MGTDKKIIPGSPKYKQSMLMPNWSIFEPLFRRFRKPDKSPVKEAGKLHRGTDGECGKKQAGNLTIFHDRQCPVQQQEP